MSKLTMEQWEDKTESEQIVVAANEPDTLPESVNVEDYVSGSPDVTDGDLKDLKFIDSSGNERSAENFVKEKIRKAKEGLESKIDGLTEAITKVKPKVNEPAPHEHDEYWVQKADMLSKELLKYDAENETISMAPEGLKKLAAMMVSITNNLSQVGRNSEKKRDRAINTIIKNLDPKIKNVIADDVRVHLEDLPVGVEINENDKQDAIDIAKGRNSQKLMEAAKKSLERPTKKIEGRDSGNDGGFIPSGGSSPVDGFSAANATVAQKRKAVIQCRDVTRIMREDANAEKNKKK